MNPMRTIKIEKLTLNVGAGKDEAKLKKGIQLMGMISGTKVVKTFTTKRIPGWGVRPGLALGCKTTIRGPKAKELVKLFLEALENKLSERNFDDNGNISFGVTEYINIPGMKYDPTIGMMGFQVSVTLTRPGFRIRKRRLRPQKIPIDHRIPKVEAIEFFVKEFKTTVGDKE